MDGSYDNEALSYRKFYLLFSDSDPIDDPILTQTQKSLLPTNPEPNLNPNSNLNEKCADEFSSTLFYSC